MAPRSTLGQSMVLALSALLLMSCTAQKSGQSWEYYKSVDGYAIDYPADWTVQHVSPKDKVWPAAMPAGNLVIFSSSGGDISQLPFGGAGFGESELRLGVMVLYEPIGGTVTESAHILRTVTSQGTQGYEEQHCSPTTIGDVEAMDWQYAFDTTGSDGATNRATARMVLAIVNGREFAFTAGAFSDTFAAQEQTVEHFFQSIELT